jgi:hypothetical protein
MDTGIRKYRACPGFSARCEKCHTIVGEPTHCVCEGCRKEIAAMEKEVRTRWQLGVTACRVCGCKPVDRSPFPGMCLGCWRHISILVSKQYPDRREVVVCPRCGRIREGGRDCPRCGRSSVGRETRCSSDQSGAGMWKPAAVWSICYLALSWATG